MRHSVEARGPPDAQAARDCVANVRTWPPLCEGWIAADNSRDGASLHRHFLDFAYASHDHFAEIMRNAHRLKNEAVPRHDRENSGLLACIY